jgi:hypothetical protein
MKTLLLMMLVMLLCTTGSDLAAVESNTLEIVFDKNANPTDPYSILMAANKIGATTCSLATPLDTYTLTKVGEEWFPEQRFLDDHANLSFQLVTIIAMGNWLLTWDEGNLITETSCLIEFGMLEEDEFPLVPMITSPPDGMSILNPDPNPFMIAWNYGGVDACVAQPDNLEVELHGPGTLEASDDLPCATLFWTPTLQLFTGEWTVEVHNAISSIRLVPDGLSSIGDPWVLDNSDWLSFRSLGVSVNDVVPSTLRSFGDIKALYR